MARKRKGLGNDYQKSFISKSNTPHENYARVYRSLFYNERFRKLSPKTKEIYFALILECKKNNRTRCTFPKSAYEIITNKQTFHKAKKELIENGFIEEISFRTKANIYKLCSDWKLDSIPKREPKYYDISEYKKLIEW